MRKKFKVKKNDEVVILTGKDKGKSGKIVEILRNKDKVVVDGINIFKHHERARKQGAKGQIIEKPMPIHISNVSLKEKKAPKEKKALKKAK